MSHKEQSEAAGGLACRRRHQGTLPKAAGFDLLHGTEQKQRDEVELYPTTLATTITFGKKSHPECAAFSPDGHSLITGSVDGFLEVWDATSGKLRKDLAFQEAEEFMVHEHPVLCVATSRDGVAIVSGALTSFPAMQRLRAYRRRHVLSAVVSDRQPLPCG